MRLLPTHTIHDNLGPNHCPSGYYDKLYYNDGMSATAIFDGTTNNWLIFEGMISKRRIYTPYKSQAWLRRGANIILRPVLI